MLFYESIKEGERPRENMFYQNLQNLDNILPSQTMLMQLQDGSWIESGEGGSTVDHLFKS